MSDEVLCVGEILWDALPEGLFLGGAPFNVACHLRALGQDAAFASRVGDDRLGHEALRRMQARGLGTELVQIDGSLPTGFVQVELGGTGEPDYEILEPVAWDAITVTDPLRQRIDHADALIYGSLAQRAATSRQTIQHLRDAEVLRVFDINLRPPYIDRAVVEQSLNAADVVKLNDNELHRLQEWFALPDDPAAALPDLAQQLDCKTICVTRGGRGAWLWSEGRNWQHPGYEVDVADAVGAGDAFLAAFLAGLLADQKGDVILDRANRLGAYVASHSGAFPAYTVESLSDILDLPLPSSHAEP